MEKRFILRGFGVGALGGLLAFVFARIFAEPMIQKAIDYENGRDAAQDALRKAAGLAVDRAGMDPFSRGIQGSIGIGTGLVLFGLAMGGLYAVAYYLIYRRTQGSIRPRTLALVLAAGALVSFYLVPFMKYPANPPAIGHADTIGDRSMLYLGMVVISVVAFALAAIAARGLAARFGTWNATLLAGLGFLVVIGIAMAVLPPLGHLHYNQVHFGDYSTETPQPLLDSRGAIVYPGFPADVLFRFRLYSVISQLILWGTIGLAFGPLIERVVKYQPERRDPGALATRPA